MLQQGLERAEDLEWVEAWLQRVDALQRVEALSQWVEALLRVDAWREAWRLQPWTSLPPRPLHLDGFNLLFRRWPCDRVASIAQRRSMRGGGSVDVVALASHNHLYRLLVGLLQASWVAAQCQHPLWPRWPLADPHHHPRQLQKSNDAGGVRWWTAPASTTNENIKKQTKNIRNIDNKPKSINLFNFSSWSRL